MRNRLIELIEKGNEKVGEHIREVTKKVLAEKGSFNSKTDYDRRNIYEIEADYLLENGVIVQSCKVGDTVYRIVQMSTGVDIKSRQFFKNGKITGTLTHSKPTIKRFVRCVTVTKNNIVDCCENYGKTVFHSREEAEQALKGGGEE